VPRSAKRLLVLVLPLLGSILLGSGAATAATIGSNLLTAPNGSVCTFQSLEPETHVCSVGQRDLTTGHTAAGGLVAPFDGVIVSWSVISGTALPGTGAVKLALRTTWGPGYLEKGPEVELPPGPPGTRHTFAERMSISAGQPFGLKISIANRSTQEAGAPIAFREEEVGVLDTWTGEPFVSIWETEEDAELLLDAEIEPDADRDGYGDLTQDICPNRHGSGEYCAPRDREGPVIRTRFKRRQAFLRSGAIVVKVASSEAGRAWAGGRFQIKGPGGWTYGLRNARRAIAASGQVTLRLRVPKRALKVAWAASREGRAIVATVRVGVTDGAGNERQVTVRIRPRIKPAR